MAWPIYINPLSIVGYTVRPQLLFTLRYLDTKSSVASLCMAVCGCICFHHLLIYFFPAAYGNIAITALTKYQSYMRQEDLMTTCCLGAILSVVLCALAPWLPFPMVFFLLQMLFLNLDSAFVDLSMQQLQDLFSQVPGGGSAPRSGSLVIYQPDNIMLLYNRNYVCNSEYTLWFRLRRERGLPLIILMHMQAWINVFAHLVFSRVVARPGFNLLHYISTLNIGFYSSYCLLLAVSPFAYQLGAFLLFVSLWTAYKSSYLPFQA